jgi:glycosyl transferase family 2
MLVYSTAPSVDRNARCRSPATLTSETASQVVPETTGVSIAIVALTYNRVHLLRQCVKNVLLRTSKATREIIIWNNASTDATAEYLDSLADPRIKFVHHHENIGQSAPAHVSGGPA